MDTLLTREPIFDRDARIAGYDLSLGRLSREGELAGQVAIGTLAGLGFEHWTDGETAFLPITADLLRSELVAGLDPARVVLMLDSNLQSRETLDACRELRQQGYRFGLERIIFPERPDPALAITDVARLSVRAHPGPLLDRMVAALRPYNVRLMAVGVQTDRERDACVSLGFDLFRGYSFHRPPAAAQGRELPIEHLTTFRLMRDVRSLDTPDQVIVDGFSRSVSLTYRLLRLVNSAAVGGRGIDSVGHAIRLLGRDVLYRWLGFLLLAPVAERGIEAALTRAALLRGRLCELLAGPTGRPWAAGSLFIIGLFSRLDLLLGISLQELVAQMDLPEDVEEALLHRTGPDGSTLALVEAYEAGRWPEVIERCAQLDIDPPELARLFFEALTWANEHSQHVA